MDDDCCRDCTGYVVCLSGREAEERGQVLVNGETEMGLCARWRDQRVVNRGNASGTINTGDLMHRIQYTCFALIGEMQ